MDAPVDYFFLPICRTQMLQRASTLCTPKANLPNPYSPRLSDAAKFTSSSDMICISSDESDKPPPQKKKLTDFFKLAKLRMPAFPNALGQFEPLPEGSKKQTSATSEFKSCRFIEKCL